MPRKRVELTRELVDAYCRALDKTTPQIAASVVGVSHRRLQGWLEAATDPECDDELLLYLLAEESKVQSSGTRGKLMKNLFEAAEVEPKIAIELAKMLMPSLTQPKQLEVKATVGPATPRIDWSRASDEQLKIAEEYARTVAQLSAGDSE
jgi:hypothetical protein